MLNPEKFDMKCYGLVHLTCLSGQNENCLASQQIELCILSHTDLDCVDVFCQFMVLQTLHFQCFLMSCSDCDEYDADGG